MTPDRRPRARGDVVFRRLADQDWALLDAETQRVHTLNLTAALVWELADGTLTLDGVTAAVRDAFDAVPATLAEDVARQVEWFVAEGLMTWT